MNILKDAEQKSKLSEEAQKMCYPCSAKRDGGLCQYHFNNPDLSIRIQNDRAGIGLCNQAEMRGPTAATAYDKPPTQETIKGRRQKLETGQWEFEGGVFDFYVATSGR